MSRVGLVIIGRNEGERLQRCILSLVHSNAVMVYVDSGSADASVTFARQHNAHVVELDTSIPFSAARARNAGFFYLVEHFPALEYVQFVDGDCEVDADWLVYAKAWLEGHTDTAIVCGRRRERYPQQSIYNLLCDIEWDTPIGDAQSCGGDFLARVEAVLLVNGFNPQVVAGEEPDLCYRLRQRGWKINRLDHEMTLHDAMIVSFGQWWRRTLRSGHAYAHNMMLHWNESERFNQRNVLSIVLWGIVFPLLFLVLFVTGNSAALLMLVLYGVMVFRIYRYCRYQRKFEVNQAWLYAVFTMLGKVPQAFGVLRFLYNRYVRKSFHIIEYKNQAE